MTTIRAGRLISLMTVLALSSLRAGVPYRDEALKRLALLENRFATLAAAMPADKYAWRPDKGVRSVSEVYLHVAAGNFGLSRVFGTPAPEGFNVRGYEKSTTDKGKVVSEVRASFAHMRGALEKLTEGQANDQVSMFGQQTTTRAAIWSALEHLSEHLGQSIAYARMNGVVPPWTAARER